MIKVEKNVAVVLSAEDIMAMNRTTEILCTMANAIEESGIDLSEKDDDMMMTLSDTADTIDQILHSLKEGKFEWTLSEEIDTDADEGFSWY